MHTYLKTEFLCAFPILKSMGFIWFFFSYICMSVLYFETGLKQGLTVTLRMAVFLLQPPECGAILVLVLVCLCFGSLGWP